MPLFRGTSFQETFPSSVETIVSLVAKEDQFGGRNWRKNGLPQVKAMIVNDFETESGRRERSLGATDRRGCV